MTTKSVYFLVAALVLPLLLLVVGCDVNGSTEGEIFSTEEAYRIDCFVPEGATLMAFAMTGVVTDEGSVEGDPLPENAGTATWSRYRMLQGEKGVLALRIDAHSVDSGARVAEGTFTILGGSDGYARLQGQGDFHATMSEEAGLEEVFEGLLK